MKGWRAVEKAIYAGAGKCDILFAAEEFPFREGRNDYWTGIHDVLKTRAVMLRAGDSLLIESVESVILDREMTAEIKSRISQAVGLPPERIFLAATHTVSAPHLIIRDHNPKDENERSARMREAIYEAAVNAARAAAADLQPAKLGFAVGSCGVNANRNIPTKNGWWKGVAETLPSDHDVPVLRIDRAGGEPLALLYSFSVELAVMDGAVMSDGGRHVTADLSGAASAFVEEQLGEGFTALFLPGLSTDQTPRLRAVRTVQGRNGETCTEDLHEEGWLLLRLQGEQLGEQVLLTAERAEPVRADGELRIAARSDFYPGQRFRGPGISNPMDGPILNWQSTPDEDKTAPVEAVKIGDVILVCVAGIGAESGLAIKEELKNEKLMLISGVSGSAPKRKTDGEKYMMRAWHYDEGTFCARNSGFGRGAAEQYVKHALALIRTLL